MQQQKKSKQNIQQANTANKYVYAGERAARANRAQATRRAHPSKYIICFCVCAVSLLHGGKRARLY
jgi:hypothetical protein